MQSAAAVLFALPRTVPVLAAVPERLTTVVEQPVEAQSWEVDAVSGATLTAEGQTSVGGIGHCASACGCRYWRRRCSSSCWAAGWVSAGLSEPKKEAAARYLCSSLLLAGMICHFYRECFCSNRSVMLCRLMPRVERLCMDLRGSREADPMEETVKIPLLSPGVKRGRSKQGCCTGYYCCG